MDDVSPSRFEIWAEAPLGVFNCESLLPTKNELKARDTSTTVYTLSYKYLNLGAVEDLKLVLVVGSRPLPMGVYGSSNSPTIVP